MRTEQKQLDPMLCEELHDEIVRIYDFADQMVSLLERSAPAVRESREKLVKPFVTQITNSATMLSVFYAEIVHKKRQITPDLKDAFEQAFANVFYAYKDFIDGAEAEWLPKNETI